MSKRSEFIDIAKRQIGTKEIGVNNVKYNTWYYGHKVNGTVGTSEYAWCVVFESWCANQVGILNILVPKCNNVGVLRDWYKAKGLYHTIHDYTPKAGDLVIFKNACHTGIITQYENGRIYTVEGNSGDKVATHNYDIHDSYVAGFCSVQFTDDNKPKPINTVIKEIQNVLNARYGYRLLVDGIMGKDTRKHLVMALQTELNKQYGANLVVDGIFGAKTKSKCPIIRQNAKGNITYLIQVELFCNDYKITLDSVFGIQTLNAVISFQKEKNLKVDGIVGKNTFEKLFKA